MFDEGEANIRSVVGHNRHEKEGGKLQQREMSMIMYRPLIDQYDCEPPGNDDKGLGCWVHLMFGGDDGVTQG